MRIPTFLLLLLAATSAAEDGRVLTGIDVLAASDFAALDGLRAGLITNHTGVAGDGTSTIRLLHAAPNVELLRIFSPEHGIEGKLDVPVIEDGSERTTGIPVVSLYGDNRQPTAAMLADLDVLVFDIQDIGTRFYTYISTMGLAMQAAAAHGLRFVVLDRPNPINGVDVAGPVLDEGRQSFTGFHRLPVRHGMTVGELALMFRAELALELELEVVRVEGWRREDWFDATGLAWIDPSPNMRSLTAALLYPGIGLLETTNLSVGRGTATPFELIGAPWLDGAALATDLNALGLPGIAFEAVRFTPESSKYSGAACSGVRFTLTDRDAFEPLGTGFAIARRLAVDYPDAWDAAAYIRLLGNARAFAAVTAGRPLDGIEASYRDGLEEFRARRANYLLYD